MLIVYCIGTVPDRRCRTVPEVVLVRRWATKGSGNLEGGGAGEKVGAGEVSSQATWDRGGRILSQLGEFQVSRKGSKGGQSKVSKGRLTLFNAAV